MGQERREFELRDYAAILLRRKWWVGLAFVAVLFGAAAYTVSREPVYQANAQLLISTKRATPVGERGTEALVEAEDLATQLQILRSGGLFQEALETLDRRLQPFRIIDSRIDQVRDTNVVNIAVASHKPEVAAAMANAMATRYIERSLELNKRATQQALTFVREQIQVVRKELDDAEAALQRFKERTRIMVADESVARAATQADSVEAKIRDLETERAAVSAELARVKQQLATTEETLVSQRELAINPLGDKLKAQLLQLQMQRLELLNTYTEDSRKIKQIDEQMAVIKQRLQEEKEQIVSVETVSANPAIEKLTSQRNALESRLIALDAQIARLRGILPGEQAKLVRLPGDEVEFNRLQRRVRVTEDSYMKLLAREQELLVAQESVVPNAAIVSLAAVPTRPIAPNAQQNMLVAAVLGLLMGMVLAVAVDYVDDSIKTPEEAEQLLGLPLLGVIGYAEGAPEILSRDGRNETGLEEAYRTLRTNIRFSAADKQVRTVAISSPGIREGKSTVAANLAIAAAHAGQNVVLVDMDMREPSLRDRLELEGTEGLTDVLIGERTLDSVLLQMNVQRLQVLPTGSIPPNPIELLESQRMKELLEELRRRADFIVIDTSPLLTVVDAQIVASMVDGVALVFENKVTSRDLLRRAQQVLVRSGANILGLVATKVRGLGRGYTHYRRGKKR